MHCKMRRHAMTSMIAAVLCLLLFSGRFAAAEKTFGGGGGGGYGGLEAGVGQQPEPKAEASGGGGGYSIPTEPVPSAGGGGGYSTPSEPAPTTPAAEETTPTTPAAGGGGSYSTPTEPAPTTPAAEETPTPTTPESGGGYSTPTEPAPSTPAAEETPTPTTPAAGGGGYATPAGGKGGLDPDGDPEVGLNEKAINEILTEHNLFRAKEHANLPPLVWNATLAKFSQQYAETTLKGSCQQIHSSSPYGENLMEGTPGLTWKITVDGWSEEKKNYHYANDGCDAGKMCGHYKAVVWKTTTSVGCGRIKCDSGDTIIMCSYWPPGNYDGVKPY